MSKKSQAFQSVSAAINLDSKGDHDLAFQKYLQCLHMLSTFLLEQYHSDNVLRGLDKIDDNSKNEMKQILSVLCDCADRAGSILISSDSSQSSTDTSWLRNRIRAVADQNRFPDTSRQMNNDVAPGGDCVTDSSINTDEQSFFEATTSTRWRRLSNSSICGNHSPHSSPRTLKRMNSNSRYPVFSKVDEENATLFRRYQIRINNARDKYAKQNLQLELQRRLAENLSIAKAKRQEAIKKQKEEKEKALNQALRGMAQNGPCQNAVQQEKQELYLEVLYYEAAQSHLLDFDKDVMQIPASDVIQRIFERTFRCSNHPLFQWLTMVQMKLKKSLSALLKEYSNYISLSPASLPENFNAHVANASLVTDIKISEDQKEKLEHLQKTLEAITQNICDSTDIIMEVTFAAYKSQLPDEADTAFYKATECSLISPLLPLITTLFRISNIPSEWSVFKTMQNCQRTSYDFGIPADRLSDYEDVYIYCIQQLKKVSSLISLVDKLCVLVNVCQRLSTCGRKQAVEASERLIGADELVPVLSYVLVRSNLPLLVSECCALQSLIDAKYMLGEEGYALSSFLTALSYLEMKEFIDPEDYQNVNEVPAESHD